jgi:hypothetical protein
MITPFETRPDFLTQVYVERMSFKFLGRGDAVHFIVVSTNKENNYAKRKMEQ